MTPEAGHRLHPRLPVCMSQTNFKHHWLPDTSWYQVKSNEIVKPAAKTGITLYKPNYTHSSELKVLSVKFNFIYIKSILNMLHIY